MSRTLARALALAVALPCSASAQILGARVTVAGGTEGLMDGHSNIPAYIGQLGLEWRRPGSRGAFRLGLMHYQLNDRESRAGYVGCSAECASWDRFGMTGLTFDGTYDLTKGRLRPYILSGIGIYRSTTVSGSNYQCSYSPGSFFADSCAHTPGQNNRYRLTEFTGGMHSGIGLSANFGRRASLFAEYRILMIATDGRRARGFVPFTLGVKF